MTVYIQPGDPVNSNRYVPVKALRVNLPPVSAEEVGTWTMVKDGINDMNQFYDKVGKVLLAYPPKEDPVDEFCYVDLKWKKPVLTFSDADSIMRATRSSKLRSSDWIVTKSMEDGVPVPEEWRIYRQKLRDVPEQPGAPFKIEWPIPPNE